MKLGSNSCELLLKAPEGRKQLQLEFYRNPKGRLDVASLTKLATSCSWRWRCRLLTVTGKHVCHVLSSKNAFSGLFDGGMLEISPKIFTIPSIWSPKSCMFISQRNPISISGLNMNVTSQPQTLRHVWYLLCKIGSITSARTPISKSCEDVRDSAGGNLFPLVRVMQLHFNICKGFGSGAVCARLLIANKKEVLKKGLGVRPH